MVQFSQVLLVLWLFLQILPYSALPQTQLEYEEEIVESFIEDLNSLDPDQKFQNISHIGDEERLESNEMDLDGKNSKENYTDENYSHENITIKFKSKENTSSIIDINDNQLIKVLLNETYVNHLGSDEWNSSDEELLESNEVDSDELNSKEKYSSLIDQNDNQLTKVQLNETYINHLGSGEMNSSDEEQLKSTEMDSDERNSKENYSNENDPLGHITIKFKPMENISSTNAINDNQLIKVILNETYINDLGSDEWNSSGVDNLDSDEKYSNEKLLNGSYTNHLGSDEWNSSVCTTVDGQQCIFPFEYSGRVYTTCVQTHRSEAPWCLMDQRANWGYCTDTCEQEYFSSEVGAVMNNTDVEVSKVLLVLGNEVSQIKHQVLQLSERLERGDQKLNTLLKEVATLTNLLQQNMKDMKQHD